MSARALQRRLHPAALRIAQISASLASADLPSRTSQPHQSRRKATTITCPARPTAPGRPVLSEGRSQVRAGDTDLGTHKSMVGVSTRRYGGEQLSRVRPYAICRACRSHTREQYPCRSLQWGWQASSLREPCRAITIIFSFEIGPTSSRYDRLEVPYEFPIAATQSPAHSHLSRSPADSFRAGRTARSVSGTWRWSVGLAHTGDGEGGEYGEGGTEPQNPRNGHVVGDEATRCPVAARDRRRALRTGRRVGPASAGIPGGPLDRRGGEDRRLTAPAPAGARRLRSWQNHRYVVEQTFALAARLSAWGPSPAECGRLSGLGRRPWPSPPTRRSPGG